MSYGKYRVLDLFDNLGGNCYNPLNYLVFYRLVVRIRLILGEKYANCKK